MLQATSTEWAKRNTVIPFGELGIATDTGVLKVGNGRSGWNSLPYPQPNAVTVVREVKQDATKTYGLTPVVSAGTYGGVNVDSYGRVIGAAPSFSGSRISIANGTETGYVSFPSVLPSVPSSIVLTVQSPESGSAIWAVLSGDPTASGFYYALSGKVESTGYFLHYRIA